MQPFTYTGYQGDGVADTYYVQAREYKSEMGRFTGEDIIKGNIMEPTSMNPYGYCWNNPIDLIDVDGRWPKIANWGKIAIGIGAIAMGATVKVGSTSSSGVSTATITYAGETHKFHLYNGKIDDAKINKVFGWEISWIPNGQTYQAYLGSHRIFNTSAHHSSVVIFATPECPVFGSHPEFRNSFSGVNYAIIGGGEGGLGGWLGTLTGEFNRKSDVNLATKKEMLAMGIDYSTILQLFKYTENFVKNPNLEYELFPRKGTDGYNSGSFLAGLLKSLDLDYFPGLLSPGWSKPVPSEYFDCVEGE